MSDGSDSLQRCEEVSHTESAEPPSSYGLPGLSFPSTLGRLESSP
jgi:hypothetical protein